MKATKILSCAANFIVLFCLCLFLVNTQKASGATFTVAQTAISNFNHAADLNAKSVRNSLRLPESHGKTNTLENYEVARLKASIPISDPISFLVPDKITASDGSSGDLFGTSISASGNTVIVGAPSADAAYIFVNNGGIWVQEAKLTPSEPLSGTQFGASVSVEGNTAVIGVPNDRIGTNTGQGSVYVFVRAGSNWTLQQKITAITGGIAHAFGVSVDIDGETIVVGASRYGDFSRTGAAYIFTRNNQVWSEQGILVASDGANFDEFGISVGIDGDTAVVGAHRKNLGSSQQNGAVYIFTRQGTTWSQQLKLLPDDTRQGDLFGTSLAFDENLLMIGSTSGGPVYGGAVYVYVRSDGNWSQQQKLLASDTANYTKFGNAVAFNDNYLIVGAKEGNIGANVDQGAAYIFEKNGSIWTEKAKLFGSDGRQFDYFGNCVAVTGAQFLIGAPQNDVGSNFDQGAVYSFVNPPNAPDLQAGNDSGISNTDNLTNNRAPSFDVGGVSPNSRVELLRDGVLVDSTTATGNSVTLQDNNPPASGIISYTARQVINNQPTSESAPLRVTYDTNAPVITLNQNQSQSDPINSQPIIFRTVFSEEVIGFEAADISLTGSTANVSQAAIETFLNTSTNYIIRVSNVLSDGMIRAGIPAGAMSDAAGNLSLASASTDNEVTLDTVAPTVVINQAATQADPTRMQPIVFDVTFSEPVQGLGGNNVISLSGSTANVTFAVVSVAGSGANYTVSISNVTSPGLVRASVRASVTRDIAGNLNAASTSTDNTVLFDNIAPTVTINQSAATVSQRPGPQPDPTAIQPVEFTAVFSEPVIGFDASDISLAGSSADVSRANIVILGSGPTYNIVVSNISTGGNIRASVLAGGATDLAGNPNTASTSTDNVVTYNPLFVTVKGRVTLSSGKAVPNAQLVLLLPSGELRYARTNPFGYYRFNNIPTSNISMTVTSKYSIGANLAFFLWEDTPDVDITIQP